MSDIFISAKIILDLILIILCLFLFAEIASYATSRKKRLQYTLLIISIVLFLTITQLT